MFAKRAKNEKKVVVYAGKQNAAERQSPWRNSRREEIGYQLFQAST